MEIYERKITIAICTYRRFSELKTCLEHVRRLNQLDQVRVLVIDNSLQRDESLQFKDWAGQHTPFLDYIITPKAGLSYARNIALLHCDTEYIAYLDDDAFVAPDWVEGMMDAFSFNDHVGIVGGKVSPIWEIDKVLPNWVSGLINITKIQ